eukprot:464273-Rhodomonas_salina.1
MISTRSEATPRLGGAARRTGARLGWGGLRSMLGAPGWTCSAPCDVTAGAWVTLARLQGHVSESEDVAAMLRLRVGERPRSRGRKQRTRYAHAQSQAASVASV